MSHVSENKDALIARVRRIVGQMQAVERALERDEGCAAVLQLAAGARGALNGLTDELIEEHLRNHVAAPGLGDAERDTGARELLAVIRRYGRQA